MKITTFVALLAFATLSFAQAPPPAPAAHPVSVLISATDASGIAINGLTKDQLRVIDDNAPATVADIKPISQAPLSVGIVLYASERNFPKEQQAAIDLINKLIRNENDRAFILTAGGSKRWSQSRVDWSSDKADLARQVKQLDKKTGLVDAFNYTFSLYSGSGADHNAWWGDQGYQSADGTTVFDAVWGMMMADRRPARRALIIFRDPWKHSQGLDLRSIDYADKMHAHIAEMAQKLHVAIYSIGIDEPSPATNSGANDISTSFGMNGNGDQVHEIGRQIQLEMERLYSSGRANVERISEQSGGQAWFSTKKNYTDAVDGITNDLAAQYLLTFVPSAPKPGTHTLAVHGAETAHINAPSAFQVVEAQAPAASGGK